MPHASEKAPSILRASIVTALFVVTEVIQKAAKTPSIHNVPHALTQVGEASIGRVPGTGLGR